MKTRLIVLVAAACILAPSQAAADVGLMVGGGSMVVPDGSYDPFAANDSFGVATLSVRVAPFRTGRLRGLGFETAYAGGTAADSVWGEFDTNLSINVLSFGASYRVEVADWFVPYSRLLLGVAWGEVDIEGALDNRLNDSATSLGGSLTVGCEILIPRRWLYQDTGRKDAWYKPDNFGVFFEAGYDVFDALVFSRAVVPGIAQAGTDGADFRPSGPALGSLSLSGPTIKAGFVANF